MKFLTILFLAFQLFVPSSNEGEKIVWNENYKLTWADFKGKPKVGYGYVASTSSGISFSYSYSEKNGRINFEATVKSNFYPENSWYIPSEASKYILKHEQTHFDISELHARMLRKKISETTFSKKIKKEIEALYDDAEEKRREMQHLFDDESDHSKIKEKELAWETYVTKQLQIYERWK